MVGIIYVYKQRIFDRHILQLYKSMGVQILVTLTAEILISGPLFSGLGRLYILQNMVKMNQQNTYNRKYYHISNIFENKHHYSLISECKIFILTFTYMYVKSTLKISNIFRLFNNESNRSVLIMPW